MYYVVHVGKNLLRIYSTNRNLSLLLASFYEFLMPDFCTIIKKETCRPPVVVREVRVTRINPAEPVDVYHQAVCQRLFRSGGVPVSASPSCPF